ncbi:MAG: PHP domain-containing protein [Acidimicrobiales bacterium]
MGPAEALRRIAFLLEADGAETYKVRAFRNAAGTVDAVDPEELRRLAGSRRLETLEGIGKSTAQVIAEALAGEVPAYLAELEGRERSMPEPVAGAELLAALRGDCHSHSNWSDGGSPIDEMARAAAELGRDYQALTDHSPRLTVAHGLSPDDLRRQLAVVAELNEELAPFRLLTGIEVDILDDGRLDQDPGLLAELDVVVASVHSKLRMESAPMTKRMVAAVESPLVDILGHCTGRIIRGRGRPQSTFDHDAVFRACAATDTAVEINSRPDRRDPPKDLLELAASFGCRFSIDSDAHAPGQLLWLSFGCEQAAEADILAESIVNTAGLDDFLAWTAGHQ